MMRRMPAAGHRRSRFPARAVVLAGLVACSGPQAKPTTPTSGADDVRLAADIDQFIDGHFAFRPSFGIDVGLHEQYDGKVPDRSKPAIAAEIERLKAAQQTFEGYDAAKLSKQKQVEREVVLAEIRKELFELDVRKQPFRNPVFYLFRFSLSSYISRDYAPAQQRAAAMLKACEGGRGYYQQAIDNLDERMPKAFIQAGISISKGLMAFIGGDAKHAFDQLPDQVLRSNLDACLDQLGIKVGELEVMLEKRLPNGTDDFRLGADNLVAMLKASEGIDTTIPALEAMAKADLQRNHDAIVAAAKQIDPNRDAAAVIADVSNDKPADVMVAAKGQLDELREMIEAKQIVSLPRPQDIIDVRASPSFMRGNFAALGGVGPFEKSPLPSYYYIAPPDPTWPPDVQRAYVMSTNDLLFTSAHEVYPGHFVQGMHERASGSRVLQIFETYTASEGWAHYVEEMMWDQGLGGGDPKAHIGQLKQALLRDVRFVVALGYHAGNLTPDAAQKLFVEQAFADAGMAKQQALRGTVDPMFLGYTLGKLLIMQLRADWQKANPGKSLREFHDEFLSYGEAPLGVTRRMMLHR